MTAAVIRTAAEASSEVGVGALHLAAVEAVETGKRLSRGVRQRVDRRCRVSQAVRDSMAALNSLAGLEDGSGPAEDRFSCLARDRLQRLHAQNTPPSDFSAWEAASELLGSACSPYQGQEEASPVVPYARERVAWPPRGTVGKHLANYLLADLGVKLEGADRAWVRQAKAVRELRRVEGAARLFHDRRLREDRGLYRDFVREGLRRGVLVLGRTCAERMSIFFVRKKMEI